MGEGPQNALVHIDLTGKAANSLVKKISRFVWGVFGPRQLKRFAKAEAEAARIAAESEIEIADLQRRAEQRRRIEDMRQQENMEAILAKAVPLLEEGSNAEAIEDDWFANLFEKSRNVSNDEMQSLWARVLAGEVNNPGSYSRRTVNAIADLDRRDCEMFTSLCSFAWDLGGTPLTAVILSREAPIYVENGISFELLTHLDSIGLIRHTSVPTYHLVFDENKFDARYFSACWHVRLRGTPEKTGTPQGTPEETRTPRKLLVGEVFFTRLGEELAPIAGASAVPGFAEYVTNEWRKMGHVLAPGP